MKKVYLMAAAAFMFASSAMAQVKFGFHAGILADIGISDNFSVAPALRYSMKGGKVEYKYNVSVPGGSGSVEAKDKLSYSYVELPVNFVYKTGAPGSARFMVGAGPYAAYLVNAHNKYKTVSKVTIGSETTETVDQGARQMGVGEKEDDELKALDYGAQAFVGYQTAGSMFGKVGASVGLANTLLNGSNTFYSKNYNFFVTIGMMLGK
ncbi:MAG: PorT family protein [Sphingobacteriales bacterium]|nr:MAG: PorT family protein [Sphingobacteriales bacterium]